MIGKLLPRALNKDTDARLLKSYEMTDAVNVQISTDEDGDKGVLKNIKSTVSATNTDSYSIEDGVDTAVVVGSVEDHEKGFVYFFVWNEQATQHAIVKYDVSANEYSIVVKGSLNFPKYGYVDATLLNDPVYRDNSFIFFTDNVNEPRKVNVNRLPEGYDYTQDITGYPEYIHACIKTEVENISFNLTSDFEFMAVNHLSKSEGFYFAFRLIHKDGFYSPVSSYSKVVLPVASIEDNDVINDYLNCVVITLPNVINNEVEKVQILLREGNAGNLLLIGEFDATADAIEVSNGISRTIWDASARRYRFYNDGNYSVIPDQDVLKIDEGVPQKASAVTLSGDRIMYGDYVDGFDKVNASAVMTVERLDRSDLTYDIPITSHQSSTTTLGLTSAVYMDFSSLPSTIVSGSKVSLFFAITAFPTVAGGAYIVDHEPIHITASGGLNAANSISVSDNDVSVGNSASSDSIQVDINNQEIWFFLSFELTQNKTKTALINDITAAISGSSIPTGVTNLYSTTTYDIVSAATAEYSETGGSGTGSFDIDSAKFSFGFNEFPTGNSADEGRLYLTLKDITDISISDNSVTYDENDFLDASNPVYLYRSGTTDLRAISVVKDSSSLFSNGYYNTFKNNNSHKFGIVYYDGRGRRSAVNKLGSCYVPDFGSLEGDGVSHINIELTSSPPAWAEKYQIVYGGNATVDDFIQFTIPSVFYTDDSYTPDSLTTNEDLLYIPLTYLQNTNVSFAEISNAKASDGSTVLYKYKEGDILRVIQYDDNSGAPYYPSNYEFEVVGVETFTLDESPIQLSSTAPQSLGTGEFLVVKNNDNLDTSNIPFNRNMLVEVYSPKKATIGEGLYFETGYIGTIANNAHFPTSQTVRHGDCFFRKVKMSVNTDDYTIPYSLNDEEEFSYVLKTKEIYIETKSFADAYKSNTPNRGRAAFYIDTAKQTRQKSSITFSERHILANGRNYLTSFNKHQNNKYDLPPKYGAINRLIDQSEFITCLQERKVSRVPIDRSIISNATGDQQLIISTEPLGTANFYRGDYGSANDPSSVINVNGNVYFVDKRVGKVLKLSSEGLSVPSDLNMSSYFEDKLLPINDVAEYWMTAGYDPMNEEVLFTYSSSAGGTFTIAFSDGQSYWKSRYTFYPTKYAHMNGRLISAKNTLSFGENLIHLHEEGNTYGVFHDLAFSGSSLSMVMNYNPSLSKVMQAVSIEGTQKWGTEIYNYKNDGTLLTTGEFDDFVEKENTWWTGIPRSKSDGYKISIGEVASVDEVNVTFTTPVTNIAIPNGLVYIDGNSNAINAAPSSGISIVDRFTLAINGANAVSQGDVLYVVPNSTQNGDPIRGQYCHVDLSYSGDSDPIELYAVNIDFVSSRLDASLGTQAE